MSTKLNNELNSLKKRTANVNIIDIFAGLCFSISKAGDQSFRGSLMESRSSMDHD
jgi:hypothetical protein